MLSMTIRSTDCGLSAVSMSSAAAFTAAAATAFCTNTSRAHALLQDIIKLEQALVQCNLGHSAVTAGKITQRNGLN